MMGMDDDDPMMGMGMDMMGPTMDPMMMGGMPMDMMGPMGMDPMMMGMDANDDG